MLPYENIKNIVAGLEPAMRWDGIEPLAAWQTRARARLADYLGLDRMILCEPNLAVEWEKDEAEYREIRFRYESEPGYFVPCHIRIPKGAALPLPAVICMQGHSTGMHISLGVPKFPGDDEDIRGGDRDFCVRAVKEGFIAIALEQRSFGEMGGNEKGPRCFEEAMTNLLAGRTTVGERVWDVMRLVDLLLSHELFTSAVKADAIYTLGNSGGGTTSVYCGAMETRLAGTIPSCAVSSFAASIGAMNHCACNYVPRILDDFDMSELMAMTAPRKLVVVTGEKDSIFPVKEAKEMVAIAAKAYEAAGVPGRIAHCIGEGGHRFYADLAWAALKAMD